MVDSKPRADTQERLKQFWKVSVPLIGLENVAPIDAAD